MSQEYIGALVIALVAVLKLFKIEVASDEVTTVVTGLVALYVAFRRYSKGDITALGARKA